MTTKAEQLAEDLFAIKISAENHLTDVEYEDLELSIAELRRLAPMEEALRDLWGQIEQAKQVGWFSDSPSIDTALEAARKALGEKA